MRWATACWLALVGCSEPIKLAWKYDIGGASESTPLVTETHIVFGSEIGVTIMSRTGARQCHFNTAGEVISAPKTDGTNFFFGSTGYLFYAIDKNCREVWKFPARDRIKSDPLIAGGVVYTSSYDGHVYALKADSGDLVWTFPATDPGLPLEENATITAPLDVGDFSYSSPVLAGGNLYVGNLDGYLYAIRAADGTLAWRFKTDGPVTSTPLQEGTTLYFGSNDGHLYALDLQSHRVLWKASTKDWVNSSPRLADGVIYFGSNDGRIYAVDSSTGENDWTFALKGAAVSIPSVYSKLVFCAGSSGDGTVYALNAKDGTLYWKYATGAKIKSDPVIVGNRLYVTSHDRTLYAFDIVRTE